MFVVRNFKYKHETLTLPNVYKELIKRINQEIKKPSGQFKLANRTNILDG